MSKIANLIIPHWCGCFTEKKKFKDSKDSSQSSKGGI